MSLQQHQSSVGPLHARGAGRCLHRRTASLRAACAGLVGAVALVVGAGCETEKSYAEKQAAERAAPKPPPVLVVRHRVGGTHYRSIVRDDVWYATYGPTLLSISADSGTVLHGVDLAQYGASGAATELLEWERQDGPRLVALLDGTAVVVLSLRDPKLPEVEAVRRANEIGFPPRVISVVGDEVWIGGDGGYVPWSKVEPPIFAATPAARDRAAKKEEFIPPTPFLPPPAGAYVRGGIGPVVATSEGLAASVGRRVQTLSDNRFVGAASRLEPLSRGELDRLGLSSGFAFILQAAEGAQVGLMSEDVREIDARAVPGIVRRVRVLNGVLVAVTDTDMTAFPIRTTPEGPRLDDPVFISVKGARDIDAINDNQFAVVGSFGRSFYRWRKDGRGEADTFYGASREPSRLTWATTDRRRILAGGPEGSWLYTIGGEVALVNQPIAQLDGRKATVTGPWGRATVAADGRSVAVRPSVAVPASNAASAERNNAPANPAMNDAGELVWRPRLGGEVFGVENLDAKLWIWHEDGIDVVSVEPTRLVPNGSVRVDGPVKYFFPQRVGGAAAFVSEFGGFGVLDFVEREALPATPGIRILDLDGDGEQDVQLLPNEFDTSLGASGFASESPIALPTSSDSPSTSDRPTR
jgi:hypothetical protein